MHCDKGRPVTFVSTRGDEMSLTQETLDAGRHHFGNLPLWLALLHDPEAQLRRYGRQIVAPGPWARDLLRTAPGEPDHEIARRDAMQAALRIENDATREAAVQDVGKLFGPGEPTSRTTMTYGR